MNKFKDILIYIMLGVILLCDNVYAIPQIYISQEVAKVTPYNASNALNTYIATQNLSGARTNSVLPGSNIQTYSFGPGSDIQYINSTGLVFGSGIVNLSLRDMIGSANFGTISTAPENISRFNNNVIEGIGMQDYSPFPLFLSGTRYWDERGSNSTSKNALLFQFPSNTVGFGARFGDIESNSLGTLAQLKLFDSGANLITGVYLTNNYSETTCGGTTVQNSPSLCGNESTRYIGWSDNQTGTVKYMLLIVGDDDSAHNFSGQDYSGRTEHLSFIGPTLATTDYITPSVITNLFTGNINIFANTGSSGVYQSGLVDFYFSYYFSGNYGNMTGSINIYIDTGFQFVSSNISGGIFANNVYTLANLFMISGETREFTINVMSLVNQIGVLSISGDILISGLYADTNTYIISLFTGSNNTGTIEPTTGSNNTGTYIYHDNGGSYYQKPMYIKNKEIVYHDQAIQIENLKIHNVIILFLDEDKDEFENDFIKKGYTNVLPNTGIDSI